MSRVSARAKKQKLRPRAAATNGANEPVSTALHESSGPGRKSPGIWWLAAAAILLIASGLRLYDLTAKVMHHDEGVNGVFTSTLFHQGGYQYNPTNFHGPSLYYAALLTTSVNSFFYGREGLSLFAIRLVPALFGIGVVWLLLCLRRQLGDFGSLAAAMLATVSPGMVFFSRYFIHELMFVFFTLGIVVAWLQYRETERPRYLILAAASAALLCTTKETWIITVAVWVLAIPCTVVYMALRGNPDQAGKDGDVRKDRRIPEQESSAPQWSKRRTYLTAGAVFIAIYVLLYSSFFMNFPKGLVDSIMTFEPWFKTGQQKDHMHPLYTYLKWMFQEEGPLLVLGTVGTLVALVRCTSRFMVFTAFWALGIFSAYSLVPYKTPWLDLSILLPLAIMAGYLLAQSVVGWDRYVAYAVLLGASAFAANKAIDLSFITYDDDRSPYVYAHTKRDFLGLVEEVEAIAAHTREGKQIGITIMAPEHWPLPWYLRDYPRAGYWGKVVDTKEPIIIAYDTQVVEVDRLLGDKYRAISSHWLRGNKLVLYLRRDLQP